jgi:hypothetical protein
MDGAPSFKPCGPVKPMRDYLDSNWNLVFHSVASLQTR